MMSTQAPPAVPPLNGERRRVTINDVAAAAGVSKTVVSHALAGYARVAPATRTLVERVAREMGYRPSARGRALAAGRHSLARCAVVSLGMAPASLGRSMYGHVLTGIAAQAFTEGMDLHLVTATGEAAGAADMLATLVAEDRADGLILLTFFPLTPADVQPLEEAGWPYVLVNRHFDDVPVSTVTPDYSGAIRQTVERLAARGHRHLALLVPEAQVSTVRDFERGWREGLLRCGIPADEAPVLRFPGASPAGGYELGRQLLDRGLPGTGQRPTAVVCLNDQWAHGVLRAAAEAAVAVPDQLSVIGFDDTVAAYTTPPLCSHDPRLHDVGLAAAALLASHLRGEVTAPQRVIVPVEFVCRGSCADAPAQT